MNLWTYDGYRDTKHNIVDTAMITKTRHHGCINNVMFCVSVTIICPQIHPLYVLDQYILLSLDFVIMAVSTMLCFEHVQRMNLWTYDGYRDTKHNIVDTAMITKSRLSSI
jgi:hypothetical protein